ncbi:ArsR family transcriptional regulator [Thermococcus aggregans]|uniref:ArsR family transcriptional regulator n=1 Tax=Thermococcus aggregans TaxID=110163 RepID=A0A9E7MVS2_THEAG|nr:ArsR family transcriptional regulator [Thermococcus aggregans]USS39885.1 ArsR family transcriptional regulator [Thermococcus aggregans]
MKTNAFEVASRYVYPSLRRRLVELLYEKGLKQTKIAELLHITQSAVSRYLNMDRGALVDISKFPDIDTELRSFADEIIRKKPDEYCIHRRLIEISLKMIGKGYICSLHAKIDPEVNPSECGVCLELFGG